MGRELSYPLRLSGEINSFKPHYFNHKGYCYTVLFNMN